jgi:hypothetical protein
MLINVIKKESGYLYFTFAENEIRLKASENYLIKFESIFINCAKQIEPFVYQNYISTLRGNVKLESIENQIDFNLTLYKGNGKNRKKEITFLFAIHPNEYTLIDKWR